MAFIAKSKKLNEFHCTRIPIRLPGYQANHYDPKMMPFQFQNAITSFPHNVCSILLSKLMKQENLCTTLSLCVFLFHSLLVQSISLFLLRGLLCSVGSSVCAGIGRSARVLGLVGGDTEFGGLLLGDVWNDQRHFALLNVALVKVFV